MSGKLRDGQFMRFPYNANVALAVEHGSLNVRGTHDGQRCEMRWDVCVSLDGDQSERQQTWAKDEIIQKTECLSTATPMTRMRFSIPVSFLANDF